MSDSDVSDAGELEPTVVSGERTHHVLPEHLFRLKGEALRLRNTGHSHTVVSLDELLDLFTAEYRARKKARTIRWLYKRQRAHLRKIIDLSIPYVSAANEVAVNGCEIDAELVKASARRAHDAVG